MIPIRWMPTSGFVGGFCVNFEENDFERLKQNDLNRNDYTDPSQYHVNYSIDQYFEPNIRNYQNFSKQSNFDDKNRTLKFENE